MTILDRALRMGEAKQFKQYEKRVDRINAWEPELELARRRRAARSSADSLRERARDGESLDDLLPETLRARPRGRPAHAWACATSTSS